MDVARSNRSRIVVVTTVATTKSGAQKHENSNRRSLGHLNTQMLNTGSVAEGGVDVT